ncbi:hypothetical protein WA026_019847 [Henosepilachna vigintioctopunctata]|uniref:Endonuclease/exonuclease/phosphatase domain-containing protein n=1 Tax=Henosepilachna vigintioctopunctata TaxID=420089 RepID=A0AAW1VHQ3_9CUCU
MDSLLEENIPTIIARDLNNAPTEPIIYPNNRGRPDIIDVCVDHNLVLLELGTTADEQDTYITRKTNWEKFKIKLNESTTSEQSIQNITSLEEEVRLFTNKIRQTLEECTTIKTEEIKKDKIPIEMKKLRREKHEARKSSQRTLHPDDKRRAN